MQVQVHPIPFFGNNIGADGLHPEPLKITALQYFDSAQPLKVKVKVKGKLLSETESLLQYREGDASCFFFGLEKFLYYAHGRPVVVESYHLLRLLLKSTWQAYLPASPG